MEFLTFLDLDITKESVQKDLMGYILNNINGMDSNEFKINPISIIPIVKKLISLLNYKGLTEYESSMLGLANELTYSIKQLNNLRSAFEKKADPKLIDNIEKELNRSGTLYHDMFNKITESYIRLKTKDLSVNPYQDFEKLYTPDFSNKRKAIDCIIEAIQLIETDISLLPKHRKKLVENLTKILQLLLKDDINWSKYFGAIKEAIIVLSALVTIAGNSYQVDNLGKAKEKLIESEKIIEKTCINKNYIKFEQHNNIIFIEHNNIKSLPNATKHEEKSAK